MVWPQETAKKIERPLFITSHPSGPISNLQSDFARLYTPRASTINRGRKIGTLNLGQILLGTLCDKKSTCNQQTLLIHVYVSY